MNAALPRVRFQLVATAVLAALVIALAASFLFSALSRFQQVAEQSAQSIFDQMAHSDAQSLSTLLHGAGRVVALNASLDPSDFEALDGQASDRLRTAFRATVASFPPLYGLYFGLPNGDFLQVIGVRQDPTIQLALDAPEGTEFAERTIRQDGGTRIEQWRFLDPVGTELASLHQPATYDPTTRDWYRMADAGPGLVITRPYLFASSGELGVTVAMHSTSATAVVGVDLSLSGLSAFLSDSLQGKPGGLVVLDDTMRVLAIEASTKLSGVGPVEPLTRLRDAASPYLRDLADAIENEHRGGTLLLRGEPHVVSLQSVEAAPDVRYRVAAFAPTAAFTRHVVLARNQVLLISLVVLVITVPAAFLASRRASDALTLLAADSERVQRLDFSGDPTIRSSVYEIQLLDAAHRTMKKSIRERTEALQLALDELQSLVESGLALASERDRDALLWKVLMHGKRLARADAATLYLTTEQGTLRFAMRSLGDELPSIELPLHDPETGAPNERYASTYAAAHRQTVTISDVYSETRFDLSGTREFDRQSGYRTVSMLAVPLVATTGDVLGVLQLLNAIDSETGRPGPFNPKMVRFVEALAAQAAMALDNQKLIDAQQALMDSLIQIIAGAIDAKSPYTGGHCERVPELALMLAEAACQANEGVLADFRFETEEEWREFRVGAWLHDCGKVTTPEYVVDKASKLETLFNRIHEIRTRFEVLLRDAHIQRLQTLLDGGDAAEAAAAFSARQRELQADFAFIAECNLGTEYLSDERIARIHRIAEQTWMRHFDDRLGLAQAELRRYEKEPRPELPVSEPLLADKAHHRVPRTDWRPFDECHGFRMPVPEALYDFGEIHNLCIRRGTLTDEERFKVNEHIIQTILMLDRLPLPKQLRRVPEYAGTHHETLIGTGYPRQLRAEDLSIPARIMAIADIFEALTASDRPYKKAKTLSESVRILANFCENQHIDRDLFELFLTSGVHLRYAKRFLDPEQIDEVIVDQYLSCNQRPDRNEQQGH